VAAGGGRVARLLVVVGTADRRDRDDLPRPVPDLRRLRPLRQPAARAAGMTMDFPLAGAARATSDQPVLVVDDLQVVYDTPDGPAKAVDHVSFSLRAGERLGLIGESGSGKTTIATALLRLTRSPGRI